jgi:hypothetical protein
MRVQLVKSQPAAAAETPAPAPVAPAPLPPPPVPAGEALLRMATRWAVMVPVSLLALGAVGWSLFIRLPGTNDLLTVHARASQVVEPIEAPVRPEEMARLREEVHRASGALIQHREQLGPLLFDLETAARRLGWRVDVALKPALAQPGGLKDLTLHPVTFRLADESDRAESPYSRLLEWLRAVSSLSTRAEVVALRLRSVGAGLGGAEVELQLFSLDPHEETASK